MKKLTVKVIGIFPRLTPFSREREELESLRRDFHFKFFAAFYATRIQKAAANIGVPVETIIEKTA